jgi:hypothetical protein
MLLPVTRNPRNRFTVATVHYSADPDKASEEWIKMAMQGMPERGWMREYEIDYTIFEGKTFFAEFKQFNVENCAYIPKETIYRGWDYGYHRPACLITKLNKDGQWCWLEAIMGKDEGVLEFGRRMRTHCISHYPGADYVDVGDPAGEQMSDKGEKTSVQILETVGIYIHSRKQPVKQGSEIIRQKLGMRVDGKPGLIVDPSQQLVIDGFRGGLHFPDVKEGQPQREHYEKDGYYEHVFDCARYLATDMFTVIGQVQMPNRLSSFSEEEKYRMGRPVDDDSNNDLSSLAHDLNSDTTDLGDYFG